MPVATYHGSACTLLGFNVPLEPVTLGGLYPTHVAYVAKMRAATRTALAHGYMLPRDAQELLALAEKSTVGSAALPTG